MTRTAAAVIAASIIAPAATVSAGMFTDYNLVTLASLDIQSDVEGRAFIGGDLFGAGDFGTQLTPSSNYQGVDVLTVGGGISANLNVNAGNLRRAGSRAGVLNLNGVGGQEIIDPTVNAGMITSQINQASVFLSTLPSDSLVTVPTSQPGPVVFNAAPGPDGIAVFDLSASVLSNPLVQQYELNVNGASSIIINVSGSSATLNQGNFVGAWNTAFARANVLWNFFEASDLIRIERNFNGALLAPQAELRNTSNIDGSVFVNSFVQRGEVHLPNYTGYIPGPGSAGLVALAGIAASRRRRR